MTSIASLPRAHPQPLPLPLPKYHQIYLVLREQLAEGGHADGLPGEVPLAAQFGVARVTVRKALERLASEGWVDRSPGRSTMPTRRAVDHTAAASGDAVPGREGLAGLLENIVTASLATEVRVLTCDVVPASGAVAEALERPPGSPVQKAVRVRSTASGPLSLITTHVPADLAQGFGPDELSHRPILLLLEAQGVRIGEATQTLTARLADAQAAIHLGVDIGSALLAVTRLVRDVDGRPVQWLHGLYRPDRYEYRMQLSRVGSVDAKVWVSRDLSPQFR